MDSVYPGVKKKSQAASVWRRFRRNKSAMLGLSLLSIIILLALFAGLLADYQGQAITQNPDARLLPPARGHILGTDHFGRDIFARMIFGARNSLTIGISATAIGLLLGCILGGLAAYYSGMVDNVIMRVLDMVACIPSILLALTIVFALGSSLVNLLIAITIAIVPGFARVIRSVMLPIIGQEFIEAARASGATDARILVRYIIPNAIGPILVQGTMSVATLIMTAASLSFIGMGVQPPEPEWGSMLAEAREFIRYAPHMVIIPGMAIVLTALSLNLIGDGLRDALDPRLKN